MTSNDLTAYRRSIKLRHCYSLFPSWHRQFRFACYDNNVNVPPIDDVYNLWAQGLSVQTALETILPPTQRTQL